MKNLFRLLLVLIIIIAGFSSVYAEEVTPIKTTTQKESNVVILANIEIYNSTIISQDENNFKIRFELFNGGTPQADIKYSVNLVEKVGDANVLVDEVVFPESVSLAENETQLKEIRYTAPEYLNGKFEIWLVSKNSSGFPLAFMPVSEIELKGESKFVEIDNTTCSLKVEGESKEYGLLEGVDISLEENLLLTCVFQNHFSEDISTFVDLRLFERNSFGDEIGNFTEEIITADFLADSRKPLTFKLPKAEIPQAYDMVMSLKTEEGKLLSNKINIHFVVQGSSATIQNVKLDKTFYKKGDIAHVSLLWTGSAGNFPNSRLNTDDSLSKTVAIQINSGKGKSCSKVETFNIIDSVKANEFTTTIERDCSDPVVSLTIKDSEGNVLTSKDISFDSRKSSNSWLFGGVILIFVILIFIIIYLRDKDKNIIKMSLFFLLLMSAFLGGINNVEALTYQVELDGFHTFTTNVNKTTYYPGETMTVSGSASINVCSNLPLGAFINATVNSVQETIFYANIVNSFISGSEDFIVENLPGNYTVEATAFLVERNADGTTGTINTKAITIPYTVSSISSSCGSADNTYSVLEPFSSQKCSSGVLSAEAYSLGIWTWNCTDNDIVSSCRTFEIADGVCGSADGASFTQYSSFTDDQLCGSGVILGTVGSGTDDIGYGPWAWDCLGTGGGLDVSCSADVLAVDGVCGLNDGTIISEWSFSRDCDVGSTGSIEIVLANPSNFLDWVCRGSGGGLDTSCRATIDPDSCYVPWDDYAWRTVIAPGDSITAYEYDVTGCGVVSASEIRVCNNGGFSGSFVNKNTTISCDPVVSLTADPAVINTGGSSTLEWSIGSYLYTITCSSSWGGLVNTVGTDLISPLSSGSYTLTCSGTYGSGSDTTSIDVVEAVSATNDGTVNPGDTGSSINVYEGEMISINVLGNDIGTGMSVLSTGVASYGDVSVIGNTVIYQNNSYGTGIDTFSYTVIDSLLNESSAIVTVDIDGCGDGQVQAIYEGCDLGAGNGVWPSLCSTTCTTNIEPIDAVNDVVSGVNVGESINISILANDKGDSLTIQSVGSASSGTVLNNGDGTIRYTNTAYGLGTDTFSYTIIDSIGNTDSATVTTGIWLCGNGTVEGAEACDDGLGNGDWPLLCSTSCTVNTEPVGPTCGNNICEAGESFFTCPVDCPSIYEEF